MPATNRNATVSGTSIYRIEGGKIVEEWSDWNLMTLMEQLGLSTTTPQTAESKARA
jgi:predicted ester cyclase